MSNKTVIFVEPTGAYSNVFSSFMSIPLLGPVCLATMARDAGYDASVLNENILCRKVTLFELAAADILCVSCITATVQRGKEIAREYRSVRNAAGLPSRVIIGGIHASMLPYDVAEEFDQVVVGEAESVLLEVLSGANTNKIVTGRRAEDLDTLTVPDFTLTKGHEKIRTWPVMTSRGCVYRCNFCSVTEMFGHDYRMRSVEHVMDEIRRYKTGSLFFVDDHFVANPIRTDRLLDAMISSGFERKWSAQLRTEVSKKPALVKKLKDAGCDIVYIGFESINPQSLKDMHKGQTVEDIKRSIKVFHDHGIMIHGMFMLGNDSDTADIFSATSDFARASGVDFVQYTILTPLPGTALFEKLEKENRLLHKRWEFYDAMHTVFRPVNFTPNDLQQGAIRCFREFYSYTNALKDGVGVALKSVVSAVKRLYSRPRFPSIYPFLVKVMGKRIVKTWVSHNQPYLAYLARGK